MDKPKSRFRFVGGIATAVLFGILLPALTGCNTTTSSEAYKPAPDKDSPEAKAEMQKKIQEVQNDPGVPAQAKQEYMAHMTGGAAPGAMSVGPKPGK